MFGMTRSMSRAAAYAAAIACLAGAAALLEACGSASDAQTPFKDYGYKPPAREYEGTLFKLSQDYPDEMPDKDRIPAFFKTDFRKDWRKYMMQVRKYCFDGNTDVDWRVENNKVRRWYHMPWQDYGINGREGIHGLTQEAPLSPFQLSATEPYAKAVAHAVGFYNEFGGYTIGQVWKDHDKPNPKPAATDGFPNGTVVCKTLFVKAPQSVIDEQVPYLVNPIQWTTYSTTSFNSAEHDVGPVTLIQMDIMIRDTRAPLGWIFGTFQYNGTLDHADKWENLVPVGLMWGNDPQADKNIPQTVDGKFPPAPPVARTPINTSLQDTVINPDAAELPATHLGWGGRLNGPVDNPRSSCLSCHMTAAFTQAKLSPLFVGGSVMPESGTAEWDAWWMQWFQDVGWKDGKLQPFTCDRCGDDTKPERPAYALDFSLQMSDSIQNFYASKDVKAESPVRR